MIHFVQETIYFVQEPFQNFELNNINTTFVNN
jgi:hypothetical protein